MGNTLVDLLVGWSAGNGYAIVKDREDEIKQGKNFYLSALCQFSQASQFAVLIDKINNILPVHSFKGSVKVLCNVVPLLAMPATLFCAAVKQGDYNDLAERYNSFRFSFVKCPNKLGERSVALFNFLSEHTGDILRGAMFAASLGLIILGQAAYGGAVIAALAYETIDRMGLVPRRISLFIEIYMPTLSLAGMLIGGTALVRLMSAFMLPTQIDLSVSTWLHQKVDSAVRSIIRLEGPSLKEIDAPVIVKREMTYQEIMEILDGVSDHYEINPSHCSKPLPDLKDLPTDFDFDKYLVHFEGIDWSSKYADIKNKMKDDDRFIDFLFKNYPKIKKEDLRNNIEKYILELAAKAHLSSEEYAKRWMKEQMVQLVSLIKGETRIKGLQQDLDEAIGDCARILPHLSSLNPLNRHEEVELEDALMKLAIEGGDYCSRGIKRACNELLRGILQSEFHQAGREEDPIREFERRINQSLQNQRHRIIQSKHQEQAEKMKMPAVLSNDTHGFDIFRLYSLGFYPLTPNERYRIGFAELSFWEFYSIYRAEMIQRYRKELDLAVKDVGEAHFGIYIRQIINENPLLSNQQKEEILEAFTHGKWTTEETLERFHRLLFVRLGVLRKRKA